VFNSDQDAQFTSEAFTGVLKREGVTIGMDGRGQAFDNIFVERLWRSVKHEDVYLKGYSTMGELLTGLTHLLQQPADAPGAAVQHARRGVRQRQRRRSLDRGQISVPAGGVAGFATLHRQFQQRGNWLTSRNWGSAVQLRVKPSAA